LPCWDLPASACLASRLPYGTEVTVERLDQVDRGETLLRELGLRQVRLRHHGEIARIEVDPTEFEDGVSPELMRRMAAAIKPLGFKWVCLDVEGYRLGSLNEVLVDLGSPSRAALAAVDDTLSANEPVPGE
jgi:uncharacterized protein